MQPAGSKARNSSGTAVISLLLAPNLEMAQHRRALPGGQDAAQRLTVEGDDLLAHGGAQALGPAYEAFQKGRRSQRLEDAIEGVVAGKAVG